MFKKYILSFILGLSILINCSDIKSQESVKIIYIGNDGFIIESDQDKILIDGLFGGFTAEWCVVPSDSIVELMKTAKPPFDNIDVILVTHDHGDHFNPYIASGFLKANPNAKLVGTEQTYDRFKTMDNFVQIKNQVITNLPPMNHYQTDKIKNISITTLRLKHSAYWDTDKQTGKKTNRHQNKENIGFLIEIGGKKIFHGGDSANNDWNEYNAFKDLWKDVDIAFAGTIHWGENENRAKILNKLIQPQYTIMMHLNPGLTVEDLDNRIKSEYTNLISFTDPLDVKIFQ